MERFYIAKTQTSPEVILDKDQDKFSIIGVSLMEHPFKFYEPIVQWIEKYGEQPNEKTVFTFRLLYINSSSMINISRILKALSNIYRKGHDVLVRWYYDERDTSIREHVQDLEELYGLPFEMVIIK